MDRADEQEASGAVREALELFVAAHGIMHVPTTGLEVARVQARLGNLVEARDAALEVLRMPVQEGEPAVFAQARGEAVRLAQELSPRIPRLRLELVGSGASPPPVAVKVTVDGRPIPPAARGLPLAVNPGPHVVVVEVAGRAAITRAVETSEGQLLEVTIRLPEVPERDVANPADESGAETTGRESPVSRRGSRAPGWVVLGVGSALLVAGGSTGAASLLRASEARDQCVGHRCPPSAARDIDGSRRLAWAANFTLAGGVIGVGVGTVLLLRAGQARAEVAFTAGVAGVGVSGHF